MLTVWNLSNFLSMSTDHIINLNLTQLYKQNPIHRNNETCWT